MDPFTQGLLGGAAAASVARSRHTRLAAGIGFAAGILADADILIRSASDPLLNVEYHRHFTHALVFIPVGGLIVEPGLWTAGFVVTGGLAVGYMWRRQWLRGRPAPVATPRDEVLGNAPKSAADCFVVPRVVDA